jgi:hypothetical protein
MTRFFRQNHQWLNNAIPSEKTENSELIRILIFKTFVHFIDEQKGLEDVLWDNDEKHKEVKEKMIRLYEWIVEDRPLLENKLNQLNQSFPEVPETENIWKFVNENHIEDIISLEAALFDRDQVALKEIIDLRDYMIVI